MKVLYIEPEQAPRVIEIDDSLKSMQQLVNGSIEPFYPYPEPVALVCNEEGKITGMPLNRAVYDDRHHMIEIMAGPFFICGLGEEDFTDLPPDLMEKFSIMFHTPEEFISLNGEIIAVPMEPVPAQQNGEPGKEYAGDYEIIERVRYDNNRGMSLGVATNPRQPQPHATWQFTEENGKRDHYWGHYFSNAQDAVDDFTERCKDYADGFGVKAAESWRKPQEEISASTPAKKNRGGDAR